MVVGSWVAALGVGVWDVGRRKGERGRVEAEKEREEYERWIMGKRERRGRNWEEEVGVWEYDIVL